MDNKEDNKVERISIRVTKETKQKIKEAAHKENRNMSNYCEFVIMNELQKNKDKS